MQPNAMHNHACWAAGPLQRPRFECLSEPELLTPPYCINPEDYESTVEFGILELHTRELS
jgi:hypothetical protein